MKILWLSHLVPYPPKGGVLQRSYHLLNQLASQHEVDLLALNQRSLLAPLFSSFEEGTNEAQAVLNRTCKKLRFHPVTVDETRFGKYSCALSSLVRPAPYTINWLQSKAFAQSVAEYTSAIEYDIIHFDTISLAPYLANIVKQPKALVLDHHNIESHMLLRRAQKEANPVKKLYYFQEGKRLEAYEKTHCPKFDLHITCSDLDSDRLSSIIGDSKVQTIPNPVDTDFFKPGNKKDLGLSLIFVGTMNWYPNIEAVQFIADALWRPLKLLHPSLSMHVIGANPPPAISALHNEDEQFYVHGFVDDIRPYIDGATLYICPISDGGGTKLKILDAFAMAKAVVAHPIACEGINVSHNSNVLFAEQASEYIETIDHALGDAALRHSIGQQARQLVVEEYAVGPVGDTLSTSFESVVR